MPLLACPSDGMEFCKINFVKSMNDCHFLTSQLRSGTKSQYCVYMRKFCERTFAFFIDN